jgi:diguanylate cyclase (GGDEF)-like protein/PAS domain S-box-containing protein
MVRLLRARLSRILAVTWLILLLISLTSAVILYRVAHQIGVDTSKRVGLADAMIDLDAHAQIDYKTQIQEWKDMLLQQYDHALYAQHYAAFLKQGEMVQQDLFQLISDFKAVDLETDVVENLRTQHKQVTAAYLTALRELPLENRSENVRPLNERVMGIGRQLESMFEGAADGIQAQTISFAAGESERIVHRYRTELLLLLALLSVILPCGLLVSFIYIHRLTRQVAAQREYLLTTLHSIADAVVVIDSDKRVTQMNEAAVQLTGMRREDAQGRLVEAVLQFLDEDTRKPIDGYLDTALRKGTVTGLGDKTLLLSRDGRAYSIEGSASPIRVESNRVGGVVLVFRDITERKKILRDIELTHAALEMSKVPLYRISPAGVILDVNDSACESVGFSHEELVGKFIWDLDPDYAPGVRSLLWETLKKNGVMIFERTLRRKNGTVFPVEVTSNYVVFDGQEMSFSFVQDTSDKKDREKKNHFLTQIYAALFHTNQALLECKTETELFERICQIAVNFGGMAMTWIGQVDEPSGLIRVRASFGKGQRYLDGLVISSRADVPEGLGPTGTAFREEHPVIVQDFIGDPRTASWHGRAKPFGWRASAAFGIRRAGKNHAVFTFYHFEKNAFTDEIVALLSEMARDIGHALDRFDLEAARRRAEEELRVAAKVFESHEAMLVTNADGDIIQVNKAFARITGYSTDEVIGKNPRILQSGLQDEAYYRDMWDKINQDGSWQGEIVDKRKDGSVYPKWLTISSVRDKHGAVTHYVGSFTDLTEHKAAQEKIQNLAYYDQLTGLPNRRLLLERLERALAISARNRRFGAVLYLDLDHFKTINDTRGHDSGDMLLQETARRIQAVLRHEDTVSRVGGDEFVVLLEERNTDQQQTATQAKVVGDKLLHALARPYLIRDKEYPGSVSIGVALYHGTDEDVHGLLKRADLAMYEAKKAGRNTLRFFDPVMQETLDRRTQLEFDLRRACEEEQFQLVFQKQVGRADKVMGAEVLLRWQHPRRGLIPPAEFIPLAEETGIIATIGRWVLKESCRRLKAWEHRELTRDLTLSVNISAREFQRADFVDNLRNVLAQTEANPALLVLELTESLLMENMEESVAKMNELRGLGISFALDDFGTGYSSLAHLKKLPINQLKIDRTFVKDLGENKSDETIVQTIIQMGKTLGIEVLAEGVETQVHRRILNRFGCHNFQGYLFGRPVALETFEQALDANQTEAPA